MNVTRMAAAAAVIAALGASAEAQTLRIAVGFPPNSAPDAAIKRYAEYIEANSDMSAKVFALSLLDLKETPPGLRDGIADVGYVLQPYYPAEFAETNLAANLSMLVTTGTPVANHSAVAAGAMTEYVMTRCPGCVAEHANQNQVFTVGGASTAYILQCVTPIRSVEDLEGKRLRSGASNFGRWAEHFGATQVAIPANEIYEALGQGAIDCAMVSAPELTNLQLIEVVEHLTPGVPGGVFSGAGITNVNLDVWRELSAEQRKVMLEAAALASGETVVGYNELETANYEASRERGIEVIDTPQSLLDASAAFVEEDVKVIAEQFRDAYGLENVDEKIATFRETVERWKGLVGDFDGTAEEFADILWAEVYSKMDVGAYAVN